MYIVLNSDDRNVLIENIHIVEQGRINEALRGPFFYDSLIFSSPVLGGSSWNLFFYVD